MPKPTFKYLLPALLLLLAACTSTPQTPEPSAPPLVTTQVPPQTEATAPPISEITVEPSGLKVAYSLSGDLWFWSETTPAHQLTSDGDIARIKLSDDGLVIAYQRGQTLWAVQRDGANPRQLVDIPAYTGRPFLGQFEFLPNSHIVYFSSKDSVQAVTATDLHRVDADAPTPQPVLLQGGGNFTFSPNGRLVALAQTGLINVAYADGAGLVSVLTFTPVNTYSDWSYIPQVVWLDNSTGFYTVIPANDPAANPSQRSRFLYVAADGAFTAQLAEFIAADVRLGQPLIAPNGSKVAYVTKTDSALDLHLIDASTADLVVASHPNAPLLGLWAWSPDSARLAYHTGDPSRPLLAGINLPSIPLTDPMSPNSLRWVDANRFLYIANGELRLGQVGTPLLTILTAGFDASQADTRYFDFAP